ncbi:MFS multidrug transporter [Trichophyton equinum CBS 127.97]|uniref:MFS multidrug transporter n=1 Tax=Trichophyton equinum (strain ATCC MYA-4606 / CBS 127.97) TaxID=559882 RepID=F2PW08_TRIEC|nr:MFS multidrug transporter [Trichophyton equinum CBS 127.97]
MLKISVFTQRTVFASFFYSFCVGGSMMTIVYYLPIWFQAIKGASAVKSGEMNIPLLLSLMIGTLLAGMFVTKVVGYAAPFMIAGAMIMTIGAGLFSTFGITTGHAKWIGYQVVYGFGLGLGMQQGAAAIQAVIPKHDTPQAISFLFFGQQLGVRNIRTSLPNIDPGHISNSGATDFCNTISGPNRIKLLQAYNGALRHVFFLAIAVSGLAVAGAFLVEWKNLIEVEKEQNAEKDRLSGVVKEY